MASAFPAGVLAAALGGFLLGRLVLRMRTIYLSIATWAFAETCASCSTAAYEFTRGDLGLSVPSLYGHVRPVVYYYTFLAVAALCLLGDYVILQSPIGYFMRAVKDDPDARAVARRRHHAGEALRLHRSRAPWRGSPACSMRTTC